MHVNCPEPILGGFHLGLRFSIADKAPSDTDAAAVRDHTLRTQGPKTWGGSLSAQQTQKNFTVGVDTNHGGQKSLIGPKSGGLTKVLYRETSCYCALLCYAL